MTPAFLLKATQAVLALPLMWFPPNSERKAEPAHVYRDRVAVITEAATLAADEVEWRYGRAAMALAVIALWHGETKFDEEVHRGLPGRYGSDKGKSKCFGQLKEGSLFWVPVAQRKQAWQDLAGKDLEATTRCAIATARQLRYHATRCKAESVVATLRMAYASYGNGKCRPTEMSREKAATFSVLVARTW